MPNIYSNTLNKPKYIMRIKIIEGLGAILGTYVSSEKRVSVDIRLDLAK